MRKSQCERTTKETNITVQVDLDGTGNSLINTPIKFLNHMLTSLSTHSLIDITLNATGDLNHHITEDIAICLGTALRDALNNSKPITRFGSATVPMDCSLAKCVIDLGNRPYAVIDLKTTAPMTEDLANEDISHFLETLATYLRANIHTRVEYGKNDHHKVEAAFKALALCLRQAVKIDPDRVNIPSTKGVL